MCVRDLYCNNGVRVLLLFFVLVSQGGFGSVITELGRMGLISVGDRGARGGYMGDIQGPLTHKSS